MENWIFDRKSTAADLTKMVKILYYLKIVLRKYFFAKLFVPLIKRSVSTNFKAGFGKLNFWRKIHSRGPYKNGENFVLSQNVLRKYFFAKFFVPLIKRSVSTNFNFLENYFWQKIHSRGPSKMVKILYYLKIVLRQNSLFHSSKEVFLQTLRLVLENWIFDWKSTAADLTKMVIILYYLKKC